MQVLATFICPIASVAAARAVSADVPFIRPLADAGAPSVITAYASSGPVEQDIAEQLAGVCDVTTGPHDPLAIIAAAGKIIYSPPR